MSGTPERQAGKSAATGAGAAGATPEAPAEWRRPPGVIMLGLLGVALLVILEGASRFAELVPMFPWLGVVVISLVWFVRIIVALRRPHDGTVGTWVRWGLVPGLIGATLALVALDVPFRMRLELGRSAMTADAVELIARSSADRSSVGLFPADLIEVRDGDLTFVIDGSGFIDRMALAYSADGVPADPYDDVDFRDLGGGWWLWTLEF